MRSIYISSSQFILIAAAWLLLIVVLGIFWAALLRRFATILKAREEATRSHVPTPESLPALLRYLFRGEYARTGDARLTAACQRLRQLLLGYAGCVGAFLLFLALLRPRY